MSTNFDLPDSGQRIFAERVRAIQQQLASKLPTRFDYIVCGAGTFGCVVAGRLAADPQTTVLLLEAGGSDEMELINVSTWSRGHRADWDFYAKESRDSSWRYGGVLELYRRRIEAWAGKPDPDYRGANGTVHVQPAADPQPFAFAFLEGAASGWDRPFSRSEWLHDGSRPRMRTGRRDGSQRKKTLDLPFLRIRSWPSRTSQF